MDNIKENDSNDGNCVPLIGKTIETGDGNDSSAFIIPK